MHADKITALQKFAQANKLYPFFHAVFSNVGVISENGHAKSETALCNNPTNTPISNQAECFAMKLHACPGYTQYRSISRWAALGRSPTFSIIQRMACSRGQRR